MFNGQSPFIGRLAFLSVIGPCSVCFERTGRNAPEANPWRDFSSDLPQSLSIRYQPLYFGRRKPFLDS